MTRYEQSKKQRAGERGMTMLEAVIAMAVVSVGALTTLGTMVTTSEVDVELKERSVALHAASSQMERILAYDYEDDIQNLVTWLQDPMNATFIVDDLQPAGSAGAGAPPSQGTITVDPSDPQRIRIQVSVTWQGAKGARNLTLPMTVTEVMP